MGGYIGFVDASWQKRASILRSFNEEAKAREKKYIIEVSHKL